MIPSAVYTPVSTPHQTLDQGNWIKHTQLRLEAVSQVEQCSGWFCGESDMVLPTELPCPNCGRISADAICSCGATIQHPDSGDLSCN